MYGGEKKKREKEKRKKINVWMRKKKKLKKEWKNNIKNKKSQLRNATTIFSQ